MRQTLLALTLSLSLGTAAFSQDNPIATTITDQIAALQADDFDTAFSYASPNIKRLFGTPERFGQMVRDGYPMVHRPAEVTMLDQSQRDGRILQRVMIRDQSGRVHMLAYQMIETDQGWQINGVQLLRAPEVGV
ncbi:DUF4864 domain-containing protein [Roseinatronobacter bogoriensis]|uniref:DUF4864 domain-containing protein n=1 Tax=Roseinatronobacter bogoriensis subsp. barguzinensis TaxID=441209 RepID=A0A2K8KCX6_9RHOB|nr:MULTISPECIES: DUF4864 domain-containing protein [Rhodobaca]ATX67311.1 DUF4864 domain-containing protein [Rhodobaca barguzinensis]MBB4206874.1 hypothetical protein [Rhodobaca bogoriensis DSM 18756]TDW41617.1 uncharacterized protein DUF4864 [Rhodobaca barguzinensis]TDY74204.1 uncharacterized protein DUF4864 [Rhodobaca bogoriensis DSM 18756]